MKLSVSMEVEASRAIRQAEFDAAKTITPRLHRRSSYSDSANKRAREAYEHPTRFAINTGGVLINAHMDASIMWTAVSQSGYPSRDPMRKLNDGYRSRPTT